MLAPPSPTCASVRERPAVTARTPPRWQTLKRGQMDSSPPAGRGRRWGHQQGQQRGGGGGGGGGRKGKAAAAASTVERRRRRVIVTPQPSPVPPQPPQPLFPAFACAAATSSANCPVPTNFSPVFACRCVQARLAPYRSVPVLIHDVSLYPTSVPTTWEVRPSRRSHGLRLKRSHRPLAAWGGSVGRRVEF